MGAEPALSPVRRRSPFALLLLLLAGAIAYASVRAVHGGPDHGGRSVTQRATRSTGNGGATTAPPGRTSPSPASAVGSNHFPVGFRRLAFVDPSRTIAPPHSTTSEPEPRRLPTLVWYPRVAAAAILPEHGFPLVVFAHGFDVGPETYRVLLRSLARSGYVVAAPTFPLTNPEAVGGLDESDIRNQPADVRFVIGRMIAAGRKPASPLHGLIDDREIAVAGHSDGADTALAVADDTCCRDPRVRAAIVLAGQALPFPGGTYFPPGSPPLLVVQGTSDTINPPKDSEQVFSMAPHPKYLLELNGAGHLPPFTVPGPDERLVVRVSVDFLDLYLRHDPAARWRLRADQSSSMPVGRLLHA